MTVPIMVIMITMGHLLLITAIAFLIAYQERRNHAMMVGFTAIGLVFMLISIVVAVRV